jgi:hypothetical protein
VAMLYAQFSHSICLNDMCDALRLNSGPLYHPFERRDRRVAIDSRTRASSLKRFWVRSSSGLFSMILKPFLQDSGEASWARVSRTASQDHPLGLPHH